MPLHLAGAVLAVGFGWWAAPPLTVRPGPASARLHLQLARHRNTVLATVAVLLAALSHPSAWLAAAITALLLGYLLRVDARSHVHLPTGPGAILAACAASALVLAAALTPAQTSGAARLLAAFGIAVAAGAVGLALHHGPGGRRERSGHPVDGR
ncbi:hypothetical protein LN042_22725 [Kitasatospora sp. RB6PN24]|uniref:hypothetical protein n=1 Tax=Kitasatospora humi TaxID=2893891 RepID=UPI001E5B20EE|nr:hypothetical protein [Kitasatospora humi]MCC9309850.1 hypothetical protein [Kitasatospora humi]